MSNRSDTPVYDKLVRDWGADPYVYVHAPLEYGTSVRRIGVMCGPHYDRAFG